MLNMFVSQMTYIMNGIFMEHPKGPTYGKAVHIQYSIYNHHLKLLYFLSGSKIILIFSFFFVFGFSIHTVRISFWPSPIRISRSNSPCYYSVLPFPIPQYSSILSFHFKFLFLFLIILIGVRRNVIGVLIHVSLKAKDTEIILMYLLAVHTSFIEVSVPSHGQFLVKVIWFFCCWNFSVLYIIYTLIFCLICIWQKVLSNSIGSPSLCYWLFLL